MSLYLYTHPLENTLFDVFDDNFFNVLIPRRSVGHSCRARHNHRYHRNHHKSPYPSLEKQLSKIFNEDNFKLIDFTPKINLSENEKDFYIHADLPGLNKDQVKMELNDDCILTIYDEKEYTYNNNSEDEVPEKRKEKEKSNEDAMETEQTEQTKKNNRKFNIKECSYGSFSRFFTIPEDADLDNIQAKMENGVLEVVFNKIEPPKPQNRTIQIQ